MSRALVAAAIVAVVLSGCSGPAPTPSPSPSGVTPTYGDSYDDFSQAPGSGGDDMEGARSDLKDTSCGADGDSWTYVGALTNSSDAAADFRVYVSFNDEDDATVGLVQKDVAALGAGDTKIVSISMPKGDWGDRTCILRVERYTP